MSRDPVVAETEQLLASLQNLLYNINFYGGAAITQSL
jgi:hypothetical protein